MNIVWNSRTNTFPPCFHFCGKALRNPEAKAIFDNLEVADLSGAVVPSGLEIVTLATESVCASSPLLRQCRRWGIPVTILGEHMGQEEYERDRNFNKLYMLKDHLENHVTAAYILYLDAADVLLARSPSVLLQEYLKHYSGRVVFGAENNFAYKIGMRRPRYAISGMDPRTETARVKSFSDSACSAGNEWKYLNAGMFVGPASILLPLLTSACQIARKVPDGVYKCDQSIFLYLWTIKRNDDITLDYDCRLFQQCNHLPSGALSIYAHSGRDIPDVVDAVYVYRGTDNFELKCSIASLRKNGLGLGKIYVYGDDPRIPDVVHVPFPDPNVKNREANITRKVIAACSNHEITDPFVLLSDDHFIMSPVFLATLPYYFKGTLFAKISNTPYHQRTVNTGKILRSMGLPVANYNVHRPMLIHKAKYIEALSSVPWDTEDGPGILCRSVYANYGGFQGVRCRDAKRRARLLLRIMREPFFSSPNHGASDLLLYVAAKFGVSRD